MLRKLVVLICCCTPLLVGCDAPSATHTLAFTSINVLPMDSERVLTGQTVLVRDGRVAAIGDAGSVKTPRGATIIDGSGKWLLPSFVDTHVHFEDVGDFDVFLAHGIGAIRNLEGDTYHLHVRRLLAEGSLRGPAFFTSGPYTNAPRIDSADQARAAVAAQAAAGYDCVKLHGELDLDVLVALGESAREAGLPVVGHVPRNQKLRDVLDTGVMHEISHAEEYLYTFFARRTDAPFEASIPEAASATARAGVVVTPTLVTYRSIGRQVQNLERELAALPLEYVSPFTRRNVVPGRNRYTRRFETADTTWLFSNLALQMKLTKALRDSGVTLTTGTDANSPTNVPGTSLHDEIALLVDAGLSRFAALRAATANGWALLTGNTEAGRIEPGAAAELVVLDGNPLDDIHNTRRIGGIVRAGVWHPADSLQLRLGQLVQRYAAERPFVNLLWDNDITDGIAMFREKRAADSTAFVFRREAMICQAFRAMRDGAPDAAIQSLDLLLEAYPDGPLAQALRADAERQLIDAAN